jgi:glucose/arabinose dehydrogenase
MFGPGGKPRGPYRGTRRAISALCLLAALVTSLPVRAAEPPLDQIRLPPGFRIERFAQVPNARQMALGRDTLFVGGMRDGRVHAVPLVKSRAGKPKVIAQGLTLPVGVAFLDGDLYISAVSRIMRIRDVERRLDAPPPPETVFDGLPTETHHGWKFIAFGPDGALYIPVGAPCNICAPDPDRYALIARLDPATNQLAVVARGVRNTVGFDWHPRTRQLWFTDNGRDWLGDDAPPDELNRLDRPGRHFGYPHCHGKALADPEYGRDCAQFTPPARELGAHVAALGMRFYTGKQFPARYRDAIFVAEHGSWNRNRKTGYRVMAAILEGDRVVAYEPFATGWLQGEGTDAEQVLGRPADVLVMPDGSLLVSDDHAGAVYRIVYGE